MFAPFSTERRNEDEGVYINFFSPFTDVVSIMKFTGSNFYFYLKSLTFNRVAAITSQTAISTDGKYSISQSLLFATLKNAGISVGIIGAISLGFSSPTNAQLRLGEPLTNCNSGALPCPNPYPTVGTYQALQGNDNTYAVFIGGDFTIQGSSAEAEGGVFVYGDLNMNKTTGIYNMSWVGVGSFVAPDDQLDYVTVGGNVNVPNAGTRIEVGGIPSLSTPARGNLRHKGTVSGNVAVTAPGQIIADPNLDLAPFDAVFNDLQTKSMCFANKTTSSNVTIDAQPWGVTISSTNGASGIYIINLDKNIDNGSGGDTGITFNNFPDDATIIINMNKAGSADNIAIRTYSIDGVSPRLRERILWNFPDAQNVAIAGSSQFWGSVLIPNRNSTTLVSVPGMNGRFIAGGDVIHNGTGNEFHNYPFRGTLPTDCNTPAPTTASISGTLYEDSDRGDDLDASEPKLPANITVNLLDSSNSVTKTTTTDANGNYSFAGVTAGSYKIQVDTTDTDIPSGLTLGTINNIPVTLTNANLTGQNFGFDNIPTNQPPTTNDLNQPAQTNPGGTSTVQVPTLAGTDPEDGALGSGKSFRIVTLPTNGTLSYDGTAVTAGQTISNYDPTKLTIDPNNGALIVSFSYAAIDSAGLVDPTPATVLMPFTSVTPITCPPGGLGTGSGYATGGNGQYITKNSIYWLDWSCGAATRFNPGDVVTKTWTAPNGISITATLSEITKALTSYRVGAYAGDKLDDLYSGVNPIGLANLQYGEDPNYKISFTMSLNGRPIPADIVTAEGESTDGPNESATWITDGDPWEVIEAAPNSSLDTRFSNGGKTLFMSDNPDRGFGSILAMTENVSNVNVQMNAGGKEAIAFGIMVPFDYGDAPASYGSAEHYARRDASGGSKPTTLTPANNLTMATLNFNTPYLGAIGPDPETVNQPTIGADGDQSNGVNDEDAFAISPDVSTSGTYSLNNIPVNNTTGSDTTLYAWIDFNKNGVFEANEFSSTTVANNATSANLSWTVPAGTTEGATYARFRITSDVLADNLATANVDERSTATAINGEVEDYRVNITLPNVLLVKRITAINGQTTTFNGTNLAAYQDDPANPYDDNIRQTPPPFPADTQNWTPLNTFMLGNTNGDFTRPNDELEYTIYFLSTGSAIAKNVLFCDRVPTNVSFIPTAFNSQTAASGGISGSDRGILAQMNGVTSAFSNIQDGDAAQYFPPGSNPASVYPNINCGGNNTNGAIVVNLGNLPNATAPATPTSSYGWVRFKSRVK
jgi:choice-of-anchor A domain-containing protein/uncharacterized repeat protein (TIGR01451 family)